MLNKLFSRKNQNVSVTEDSDFIKNIETTAYQKGYAQAKREADFLLEQTRNKAFDAGKKYMQDRYVAFMEETLTMVKNNEMSLIESI